MTHHAQLSVLTLAVGAAMAACTGDGPDDQSVTALVRPLCYDPYGCADEPVVCDLDGCGKNAATVGDGVVFDEIHTGQVGKAGPAEWNRGGVRLVGARVCQPELIERHIEKDDLCDGTAVPVRVFAQRDQLVVAPLPKRPLDVAAPLPARAGLLIELEHRKGARYELYVRRTTTVPYWTSAPGTTGVTPVYDMVYRMTYKPADGNYRLSPEKNFGAGRTVCGDEDQGPGGNTLAVAFEGDRYDNDAKTVTELRMGSGWFNLACTRTAAWKMHRLRHTNASLPYPVASSIERRQAMLKMLTADYCGGGRAFTISGQPLAYADAGGWFRSRDLVLGSDDTSRRLEALWGPDGAICLNEPRRIHSPGSDGLLDAIRSECARLGKPMPPPCSDRDVRFWNPGAPYAMSKGYVLSANPASASAE